MGNAPATASSSGSSSGSGGGGYGSGAPEKRSKELFELQVLSDTHLEFDGVVDVVPSAPYLALLGDIGLCCDERFDQLHAFILKVCSMFRAVFFVYGNHEGYGTTIEDVTKKLRQLQSSIANFVFLDCDSCDVPGTDVRILGCSLWSDIKPEGGGMLNDFVHIRGFDVETYRQTFLRHAQWLEDQCTAACASDKQIVILTHHAPFTAGLVPNVSFGAALLGSGCVGSDLLGTRFTTARFPTLRYWLYGHTHLNKNTTIGGVHTLSNQMGYPQDTWKSWALSSVLPGYTTFQPSLKITLM